MDSTQVIKYKNRGFDNEKYFKLQKASILERIKMFKTGRLYLELGGHFFYDAHAARCLPGFDPGIKVKLFADLMSKAEIIFCINYNDIVTNRQLKNKTEQYQVSCLNAIKKIENSLNTKVVISINLCPPKPTKVSPVVQDFIRKLESDGRKVYKKYFIDGYPDNTDTILSQQGFGHDEYIELSKNLALVIAPASNNGKLSAALGQIYLDHVHGLESGFAKFELFPIWNLPIEHPINLAYEAATADVGNLGDYNVIDRYHKKAYGISSVNYNRDIGAFHLLLKLAEKLNPDNHMRNYKSPTDMGVNQAGYAIIDDQLVALASYAEIQRRQNWYQEIVARGDGKKNWVNKCIELEKRALQYLLKKGYDNPSA